MEDLYFKVESVLGIRIRVTKSYWGLITLVKHPSIKGLEYQVMQAIKSPVQVRRSLRDPSVHLYYKKFRKYFIVAVCKHLNGEGYLITAYLTDKIKIGEIVWTRH
jgi:hypothetical protein